MSPVPVREKRVGRKGGEQAESRGTAVAETAEASGASVDKIRDILFGSQIKNYETALRPAGRGPGARETRRDQGRHAPAAGLAGGVL